MTTKKVALLVSFAGLGVAASSLALAAPASADNGGTTSLNAANGTVGVNQVITGTYVYPNGDYPTCFDPRTGVQFDFQLSDGTDLGTTDATCSGTSTWTATMNWTPSAPGSITITAAATEPNFGGSGNQLGQASRTVSVAAPKPAPSTVPSTPQNLKVTGVSTSTVSLNWDTPANSGTSPISGYTVKWSGPTNGQIVATATNANIGTLNPNASYTFSVSAGNASGWGNAATVTQRTATPPAPTPTPTPAPVTQQVLVGPMWTGGAAKVKSNVWKTFNNTQNLDTNAGYEASLSATQQSGSVKSVTFRYVGDQAQVLAVLKPGAKKGSFTLVESAPAVPGFTSLGMTRVIKVVK